MGCKINKFTTSKKIKGIGLHCVQLKKSELHGSKYYQNIW